VYANFSYSAGATGGAASVTADQIILTPLIVVPATSRFSFSAPWSVDPNQTQESIIRYTIVPPPGLTVPSERQLTLGSVQVGGIFGRVAVNEITNVGKVSVFTRCTEVCQTQTTGSLDFDPVSVVLVTDHVHLSGGNGGASLNGFGAALNRCVLCV
jgi:hypothetical protein